MNTNKNKYELNCIKVTYTDLYGKVTNYYMNYNDWVRSFDTERWKGERRYNKKHGFFGYNHTRAIIPGPFGESRVVYDFKFPENMDDAIELDELNSNKGEE